MKSAVNGRRSLKRHELIDFKAFSVRRRPLKHVILLNTGVDLLRGGPKFSEKLHEIKKKRWSLEG